MRFFIKKQINRRNILTDETVSLKAKGLFAFIQALSPDDNLAIEAIATFHRDGPETVRTAIHELVEAGYIETTDGGRNSNTDVAIQYNEIINYLNKKSGKLFRANSKTTQRMIRARWLEGYRLPDFKKVIDNKVEDWEGTDLEMYIRPITLFNNKFESYLNQKERHAKLERFKELKTSGLYL